MGFSIAGLKKWMDGAANDVQGAYHQVNPWDQGRTFSTNSQGVMPTAPTPNVNPNRNFFQKSWDQVNMADNGRSFSQYLPQNDRSIMAQASHNGATNLVGNLLVKPFVINPAQNVIETGRMISAEATGNLAAQRASQHREWENVKNSIPGWIGGQVWHAGGAIKELPRAIQGDVMGGSLLPQVNEGPHGQNGLAHFTNQLGFLASNPAGFVMDQFGRHPHAPTAEQQAAYNRGLQNLNQTAPGQMVSPVEGVIGDMAPSTRDALRAGGYNPEGTFAQKYVAAPVMGLAGTYGLVAGAKGAPEALANPKDIHPIEAAKTTAQDIKNIPQNVKITANRALNTLGNDSRQNKNTVKIAGGQRPVNDLQTQLEGAWNANDMSAAQKVINQMPPELKSSMQALQDMKAGQATTHPIVENGKIKLAQNEPQTVKISGGKPVEPSQPGFPSEIKTKGFIQTILDDPKAPAKLKAGVDDLTKTYQTRNTDALQIKAKNFVKENTDAAIKIAKSGKDDISVTLGNELISKWNKEGNIELSIDMAKHLADTGLELGRGVQAFAGYSRLSPEGILRFAQREIDKYNELTGRATGKKGAFGVDRSPVKLSTEAGSKLVKMAEEVQKLPEGSIERAQATARMVAEVQKQMPATLAEKLGTAQTMAQLLNLKTNVRNILGNGMFGGLENLSQTIATPVDALLSAIRGSDRTTTLPSLKTQGKNFIEGGKTGIVEAKQGINTGPSSQFDLNSVPVFRGKILGTLEKTMNGTLRGADRAAYEAAFSDTIRGLQKLQKTDKVTPDMLEQAHHTALYRTFQDSNAVSDFFVGMKKSLNKVGIGVEGKRFGLGDIVLKYPKTPGNLLARGIDYSPAGFLKATFEASKPLFGHEFNQKAFVDSFSRAVTGSTVAFGMGYVLADNGIITAAPSQNKDLRNVQKTAGLGGYQINASAFKRWVASGFNKDAAKLRDGDTLVSYDWAQPAAIPLSAGAELGAHKPVKEGAATTASNFTNSANTLVEQPLLQGVQRLFGGYGGIGDAAVNTATSAPASFVPTALSQVNQMFDNNARITTDQNPVQSAINQVKAKVPGAAQTLPVQYDVLGNPKERYQNGGNNPFNVAVNPAFFSKYNPQPASNEVLGLYNRTGETKQTPNTAPTSVKITGADGKPQTVKLTGQQQSDYQKFTGKMTTMSIDELVKDPNYQQLPDSEKVKLLSAKQSDINNAAKVKILGDNPADIDGGTASVLAGSTSGNVKMAASANEKVAVAKFADSKDKMMQFGNTLYYKAGDGSVKSMPKAEYDFNIQNAQLSLNMDRAQAKNDLGTWMSLAERQYNALEKKKSIYDPGTESDKIAAITLQQENLMQKAQKYQEYGGFTKGSGGKGNKGLPSIDVSIPSGLMGPVVSQSSYKAPTFQLKNKGSVRVAARKRGSVKIKAPSKLA